MGGRKTGGKALSQSCGASTIHLIASCSKSKSAPAAENTFPYELKGSAEAIEVWRNQICAADRQVITGDLYKGLHWQRARSVAHRHAAVELWAVSAGLGLRHVTDPAVPYECTFHVLPYSAAEHWRRLTAKPPLPGRCPTLAELMRICPQDQFVLAVSPVYLRAIENDILSGLPALTSAEQQLNIITSKAYHGALERWVTYSHSGMLEVLKTNCTALNISLAGHLIDKLVDNI
ncbi:hypothetical protein [Citrobacter koseri]|mgnify:CR=1 FL=1|uniref:hypothetical protein n=1 Tax=Citrobacter koseri TaxID=545 RepID=UPI001CE3A37F|nr:hypothetical protein [Citrobacter koseri]